MRTPIAAGNWKMNLGPQEAEQFARTLRAQLDGLAGVDTVLFPPYIAIAPVHRAIAGSTLQLGAQNCADVASGAYTGEVSAPMIAELCRWVILGHSERRIYFGETDTFITRKALAALGAGLQPIVCIGESIEDREANLTERVITAHLQALMTEVPDDQIGRVTIAYEPYWAIGTGHTPNRQNVEDVVAIIRALVAERYGMAAGEAMRILYGGSVTSTTIQEFTGSPHIDGALIGGASLTADFVAIANAIAQSKTV